MEQSVKFVSAITDAFSNKNKLETFEDALFEGGKISTRKTEELEH